MDVRWNLKSHLTCTLCENFGVVEGKLGHTRCMQDEIWKVISCVPCMRTLVVEGTLGHARWMRGKIWKVISCTPHVRTLLLDVTSLMSQSQMRKICRNFPLYTFQMSSCVDARWYLKSHLVCTSRENFGVVEGKLGHTRRTQCEIWKVISHAPCMRTLVWWRGNLVMLDGCKVRFEKVISHARHMRTLY